MCCSWPRGWFVCSSCYNKGPQTGVEAAGVLPHSSGGCRSKIKVPLCLVKSLVLVHRLRLLAGSSHGGGAGALRILLQGHWSHSRGSTLTISSPPMRWGPPPPDTTTLGVRFPCMNLEDSDILSAAKSLTPPECRRFLLSGLNQGRSQVLSKPILSPPSVPP